MNPLDALTPAEHAMAVVGGVAIGLALFAPIAYGFYRLERWDSDRKRANRKAIRDAELLAAMQHHPAGGQVVQGEVDPEFEATARKFLRRSA